MVTCGGIRSHPISIPAGGCGSRCAAIARKTSSTCLGWRFDRDRLIEVVRLADLVRHHLERHCAEWGQLALAELDLELHLPLAERVAERAAEAHRQVGDETLFSVPQVQPRSLRRLLGALDRRRERDSLVRIARRVSGQLAECERLE